MPGGKAGKAGKAELLLRHVGRPFSRFVYNRKYAAEGGCKLQQICGCIPIIQETAEKKSCLPRSLSPPLPRIPIQPQICCNWAPSIATNLRLYTNFLSILEVELAFPQVARKPPSSDSYTTANMLQRAGADCSKFAVVCSAAATWMRAWLSRIALTRRSRAWEG